MLRLRLETGISLVGIDRLLLNWLLGLRCDMLLGLWTLMRWRSFLCGQHLQFALSHLLAALQQLGAALLHFRLVVHVGDAVRMVDVKLLPFVELVFPFLELFIECNFLRTGWHHQWALRSRCIVVVSSRM